MKSGLIIEEHQGHDQFKVNMMIVASRESPTAFKNMMTWSEFSPPTQ